MLKKLILIFTILYTLVISVSAQSVTFKLNQLGDSVSLIRYLDMNGQWQTQDSHQPIRLENFNPETDHFVFQQFSPSYGFSPEYSYIYEEEKGTWQLEQPDSNIVCFPFDADTYYRYKVAGQNGGNWIVLEKGQSIAILPSVNDGTVLTVEASDDGEHWGKAKTYTFSVHENLWKYKEPSGAWVGILGHLTNPEADMAFLFENSYGGEIDLLYDLDDLALNFDITFHISEPNDIWPDTFYILGAAAGLGYPIDLNESFRVVPSLSYGVMAYISENDSFRKQTFSGKLALDYWVSDSFALRGNVTGSMLFSESGRSYLIGLGAGIFVRQ